MKNESSMRFGYKAQAIVRCILTLAFSFSLKAAGSSAEMERIPGLKAKGGVGKLEIDPARTSNDFKDIVEDMAATPTGALQFWTWLQGNAEALKCLGQPGVLPLVHEVIVPGIMRERIIDVVNVGEEKRRRPEWRRNYLGLLANEFSKNGSFVTSALSRYDLPEHAQHFMIRFRTSDGKVLANADGKPILVSITAPR